MNVVNHALAGGLIAVTIKQPALVLLLAFASHFLLDALPHYGYAGKGYKEAFKHRLTFIEQAINALLLIGVLVLFAGHGWLPYIAAAVAISPDIAWVIRYFFYERKNKPPKPNGPIVKFHQWVQWCERPWGIIVEYMATIILTVLFMRAI